MCTYLTNAHTYSPDLYLANDSKDLYFSFFAHTDQQSTLQLIWTVIFPDFFQCDAAFVPVTPTCTHLVTRLVNVAPSDTARTFGGPRWSFPCNPVKGILKKKCFLCDDDWLLSCDTAITLAELLLLWQQPGNLYCGFILPETSLYVAWGIWS